MERLHGAACRMLRPPSLRLVDRTAGARLQAATSYHWQPESDLDAITMSLFVPSCEYRYTSPRAVVSVPAVRAAGLLPSSSRP